MQGNNGGNTGLGPLGKMEGNEEPTQESGIVQHRLNDQHVLERETNDNKL